MMSVSVFLLDPTSWDDWKAWGGTHGFRILLIIGTILVVDLLFRRLLTRWFLSAIASAGKVGREDPLAVRRRADTLVATVNWVFGLFLGFVGAGLLLAEVGLNVSALIAGVGIVGLGIGLGAQTLVKDVLNGVFILIEDQYGVGDVVSVGGVSGVVVELNPRRTVLRDLDGNVHHVPNSQIEIATNMTQGFSRINLDIEVAYEEDLDHVAAVIDDVCQKLAAERADDMIQAPKVLRVNSLGASGVVLKITGDVKIFKQWELTGELRKRIKARFDEEGIEIPYPHQTNVPHRSEIEASQNGAAGVAEKASPSASVEERSH